jgi:heme-degrading monooxygenase HmoA
MLVDMYKILSSETRRDSEIVGLLKKVQLNFKGSTGCLGQRLLRDLEDRESFIAVSYWRDRESLTKTKEIHAEIDRALSGIGAKTTANTYELIQEL